MYTYSTFLLPWPPQICETALAVWQLGPHPLQAHADPLAKHMTIIRLFLAQSLCHSESQLASVALF
jgi:hypothetical protein